MSETGDGELRETPTTWADMVRRWVPRAAEIVATGAVVFATLAFVTEGLVLAHNTVHTFEMFAGTEVDAVAHGESIIHMSLWAAWAYLVYWWQWRREVSE
jgi:hypothetical protein